MFDADNHPYHTCSGAPGELFPVLFDRAGVFYAVAAWNDVSIGLLVITVTQVDLQGPIACQIGFTREKDVIVYGPAAAVVFTAQDPTLLEVSVKETTADGVRLYLRALGRGTPVLQARLGSAAGPVIAQQEIDEFEVETTAVEDLFVVLNGEASGTATLRLRPFIPDLRLDYAMFAHYSTFYGGARELSVNTSDPTASTGEPGFRTEHDDATGEDIGVFDYTIEVPPTETRYCFSIAVRQAAVPRRPPAPSILG